MEELLRGMALQLLYPCSDKKPKKGEHMKSLIMMAVISLATYQSYAQSSLNQDVDQELDQLYSNQGTREAQANETIQTQNVQLPAGSQATRVQNQPIYIVSPSSANAAATQNQVQKQPTTVVQASPMIESRAEQIKRARQDQEMQTETRIVEKLEQSRIEDEKRRADALFGDRLNQQQQVIQQAPVVVAPAVQQVPVEVVAEPKENTRDIVREELKAALVKPEEENKEKKYFSALVGISEIQDASNVRGNYALGAAFGTLFDESYAVEGSLIYSNYTMNPVVKGSIYGSGGAYYTPDMDVNAYSGAIAVKYLFFNGMVKPVLGGLVQYTYRTYSYDMYGQSDSTNSHAVDLGVIAGADIQMGKKFSIGVDYRYLFNVSSRRGNSAVVYNQPYYGTALESLNSYVMSVSAKVLF